MRLKKSAKDSAVVELYNHFRPPPSPMFNSAEAIEQNTVLEDNLADLLKFIFEAAVCGVAAKSFSVGGFAAFVFLGSWVSHPPNYSYFRRMIPRHGSSSASQMPEKTLRPEVRHCHARSFVWGAILP